MIVVFLGAPGTGKGSQAKILEKEFGLSQVSTGEMLRGEIKKSTELGKLASSYLDKGELLPNEVMIRMIENLLISTDNQAGYIFDGFPRTLEQAEAFDNLLKKISKSLDYVLYFHTSRESLIKRLISRRICSNCGKDYNLIVNPSLTGVCDLCNGVIVQRDDDKEEVINHRMAIYEQLTQPLINYYTLQDKLKIIDSEKTISDIYEEIKPMFVKKSRE